MKTRLHEAFSKLLSDKLSKYTSGEDAKLNSTTCMKIYSDIFETIADIISQSKVQLSNESLNYISQQYYDGIIINNNQELDPNIFTQRAKLENIETKELTLLAMMLNGTDFVVPIIMEVKKRS